MQPDTSYANVRRIAQKEITLFFASPTAYLFLGTFAAVTLFVFFWGESFFARNIADVRPLFEWMPLLLIFLASTLTMRLWSEERRNGTLEHVLTQAIPLWHFVAGKFLGCLTLLAIALLITLPLPITVSLLANLDWGPVLAGYLATFLLGATYLSVGLFVSARSDNQIVSLISATALCTALYLLGNPLITDFVGQKMGDWLRLLGTGSRFDSITRGVIDLRDLYYYLSLIATFLILNTYTLERDRWAHGAKYNRHRRWRQLTALAAANVLVANLWLGQLPLRIDVTQGQQYSLSDATKGYLAQLQEPLVMRGYFSAKTHPLLAPLVPQLKDILREYAVLGGDKVRVEFIDPAASPEHEEEANQRFGIQPTPFQVAERYQASIVSSYFNVLVQYGDEYEVLGFRDLIELRASSESDLDVQLRNPEHDLTRAVRKVLHSYQTSGNLFATVKRPLSFTAYISAPAQLPEQLADYRATLEAVIEEIQSEAGEQLSYQFIDPERERLEDQLAEDFGFQPMATSLFSDEHFYFYMLLSGDDQHVQIPLGDLSEEQLRRNLDAGIKRFADGFTKTVALAMPETSPQYGRFSSPPFSQLESALAEELHVKREDLSDGSISGDADLLFLAAPEQLDEKAVFALDQFLMKGGTVVIATSPFQSELGGQGLGIHSHISGLEEWLAHHGLSIGKQLVMDPQNAALPVPVTRSIGGFQMQELRMLDYPYFIDVRGPGLNKQHPITADLPQLTFPWASPIELELAESSTVKSTELLRSSGSSWLSTSMDVMPRISENGESAFQPEGTQSSELLGVALSGRFTSFFKDKGSPLLNRESNDDQGQTNDSEQETETEAVFSSVIEHSPESARIVVFSSNEFLTDQAIQLASSAARSEYLASLQLAANTVDWALDETGLLNIRGRGHFNRTLPPMDTSTQQLVEYLNYGLAALALLAVAFIQRARRLSRERVYQTMILQ